MRRHRGVRRRQRSLPLTAVAVLLLGTAACTSDSSPLPGRPRPTPPAQVDLAGLAVPRAPFCDLLDAEAVSTVLGGEPTRTYHYEKGDRRRLAAGLTDVAHEYNCTFSRNRRTARAWVFAQPLTPADGRRLLADLRADPRCRPSGTLDFGSPGLVQSCAGAGQRRVAMAGLFADGWLSCQVTGPLGTNGRQLLDLAQSWCAQVVTSAAAP